MDHTITHTKNLQAADKYNSYRLLVRTYLLKYTLQILHVIDNETVSLNNNKPTCQIK